MEAKRVIEILQRRTTIPGDGYSYAEINEAIDFAIREVGKCIPVEPIRRNWCANTCPTCGADLGGECYDGYYKNPYYERCPECGQQFEDIWYL